MLIIQLKLRKQTKWRKKGKNLGRLHEQIDNANENLLNGSVGNNNKGFEIVMENFIIYYLLWKRYFKLITNQEECVNNIRNKIKHKRL